MTGQSLSDRQRGAFMAKKRKSAAGNKVKRVMHEMKEGTLRSGGSGKKVKDPKQAIAIGLSEARKAGARIPKKKTKAKTKTKTRTAKKTKR
jgi:hypothetical protein